jgi:hypothetical protein
VRRHVEERSDGGMLTNLQGSDREPHEVDAGCRERPSAAGLEPGLPPERTRAPRRPAAGEPSGRNQIGRPPWPTSSPCLSARCGGRHTPPPDPLPDRTGFACHRHPPRGGCEDAERVTLRPRHASGAPSRARRPVQRPSPRRDAQAAGEGRAVSPPAPGL